MGRGGERWTLGATRGDTRNAIEVKGCRAGGTWNRTSGSAPVVRPQRSRARRSRRRCWPTLTVRQFGRKNQRCQAAPCRAGGGIGVRSRRRCRRGGAGISRKLTSRRVRLDRAGPPGTQCARGSLALERATIPTSGKRPVASDLRLASYKIEFAGDLNLKIDNGFRVGLGRFLSRLV